ncbi:NHL repeat-containing protein [Flavobacterium microcysteis]|uniref:SdiA-regulated family protein n=1 Tax=Flavobacterium microcysteis TaxID=2596891 RepID=A0A501Q111_9FLAO|nr:hypothetical protein [Flavobacterium microcysteis]TPD65696.1 hypothetical protein FJA49_16025 [Flavobacterium microcysteis]
MKSLTFLLIFSMLFSCSGTSQEIPTNTKKLSLKEASAVAVSKVSDLIWVAEDSGNKNKIYGLAADGKISHTVTLENAKNVDWEDLTADEEGNLYVGDFGNNDNIRKDLCIYKVNAGDLKNETAFSPSKIEFYYPEQKQFPPKKSELFYDAESFFIYKGNFYIFTKNRSKGFDGTVMLYKVPNQSGNHKAQLLGKFKACDNYHKCAITSADISPDGKKIALLSSSKVWILSDFKADDFLNGKTEMFELNDATQKEGVCFKDNQTLLIVDEKSKKTGGNLYEIKLSDLKSKS